MSEDKVSVTEGVYDDMSRVMRSNFGIKLISLATVDGFHLSSCSNGDSGLPEDALSAVASTMCAMSTSCSKEIISGDFDLTTVETSEGSILFLSTQCSTYSCVLCMAADNNIALGQLRFIAKQLALDLAAYD